MKKKTKMILILIALFGSFGYYLMSSLAPTLPIEYEDEVFSSKDTDLHYIGKYTSESAYDDFTLLQDTLILASESYGHAKSLNISNLSDIREIGDLTESFQYVYAPILGDENDLYMGSPYGIKKYDVTNPQNIEYKGILINENTYKMDIKDGLIYQINDPISNKFYVVNASAKISGENSGLISNWTAPSEYIYFEYMEVFDNLAILGYQDGIILINITNPYKISYLGEFETEQPKSIVLQDRILYISDNEGLKCLNISDLSNINLIKEYVGNEFRFKQLVNIGGYAVGTYDHIVNQMVSSFDTYLICLDLRDPYNVKVIAENLDLDCYKIVVRGDYVYILGSILNFNNNNNQDSYDPYLEYSIVVLKLADILNTKGNTESEIVSINIENAEDIYAKDSKMYVAGGESGLIVLDISNIKEIKNINALDTNGYLSDVYVKGNIAYLADGNEGLKIYNVADPANMKLLGSIDNGGYTQSIDLNSWFIALAEGNIGLSLINLSDFSNLETFSIYNTAGNVTDVKLKGDIAYITDWAQGLRCIDISDKYNPSEIGFLSFSDNVINIDIQRDFAFIATSSEGLKIVNISDPTSPQLIYSYDTGGILNDVQVFENYACLSIEGYGVEWINITEPNNPLQVGYINSSGEQKGIQLFQNYAIVADGKEGIKIIKIKQWANDDLDDDGLNYLQETWNWGTNLFNNDTDGDGLIDSYEAEYYNDGYVFNNDYSMIMRPTVADSNNDIDSDSLTNIQEFQYGTNPFRYDSDGDRISDDVEILENTDPLDPKSYNEPVDNGLFIYLAVIVVVVILMTLSYMGVFSKRPPLNIFLSHAVIDFEKRRIQEMSETLEELEVVNKAFYCEQDMKGNIDDWMDEMVPLSNIFVFMATQKSVHNSVDCAREIRLANENGLFLIPIKTSEVTWEDIEKINLPGEENGLEYPDKDKKPKGLYKILEEKLTQIQESLEKLKKSLEDNDIIDLSTLEEVFELEKGDAYRLTRILIKNNDIKGATNYDNTQFLSASEIKRQAKIYLNQSEDKSIKNVIEGLGINPFFEHEVYELIKNLLGKN